MARSVSLLGWRRTPVTNGIVITMQLAGSLEEAHAKELELLNVALNDRQLRSLARDLIRAADERGMDLFHRPQGWRKVFALFRR